jgi:hypothetical protein
MCKAKGSVILLGLRFEVLQSVSVKMATFCDVRSRSLIGVDIS